MSDRTQLGNTTSPPMSRGASTLASARGMGTYTVREGTKPILAPYTLEEGSTEQSDPSLQARLFAESVGYENLARNKFVANQAQIAVQAGMQDVFNVQEFLRNKWLILYRLYRGETLAQFEYGRSQLHSPEPFKTVENQHPRLMRALFGNQRWFKFLAEGNSHDENAEAQERMCRDQIRAMSYLEKASRFIRDGQIYGTAIQKTYWKQETGEVCYRDGKRVPNPDFPGTTKVELKEVKREEVIFDGNWVDNVSIFDFMAPPSASSIKEAEWCADRSSWPDYKVKMMGELGHWVGLDALKDHQGTRDLSFGDEFKERKNYAYGVFDPREASHAPHIPHYEVVDWWGPLVVKKTDGGYETKQCNVVMIDPKGMALVVRVTVNPFWHQQKPYQAWRPITLEQELYGIGTIEMIARLSMELDMKRNLGMAAIQIEGNPAVAVADDANIPDGQLMLRPGKVFRVPDPKNSIVPIHIPQVSDTALKGENVLVKDIRETAGTTSPSMGAASPFGGSKTATQHTSEIDEANTRLAGPIFNWEVGVGESMLHQMAWNNQQFMSYSRVVREVGAFGLQYTDRYTIEPGDIIGRFIVSMLAGSRWTMKQQQVQQLVNLLDRAPVINQLYGPQAIKMIPLFATILREGFDIRNVEDFVSLPPEQAGLMTSLEEHQLWYHGRVNPVKQDDNHAAHWQSHMEELATEQFELLAQRQPAIAARARAHVMEHMRWAAQLQEGQMKSMMEAMQQGNVQNLLKGGGMGGGGGAGPEGAATPDQDPDSPQIRANETARSNGAPTERPPVAAGGDEQSTAMQGAPNLGAQ